MRLMAILVSISMAGCLDYPALDQPQFGSDALDGGDRDAGTDADAGSDPGPFEFCSGAARVQLDQVLYDPVTVTADQLIMDCCEGAFLHFHLTGPGGTPFAVMVRLEGMWWEPGEYELDGDPYSEVAVCMQDDPWDCAPLSGWMKIECENDDCFESGVSISLCATAVGGTSFSELRLWGGGIRVMPYSWWGRWGIYLLEDPSIDATQAASMPLSSLVLDFEPQIDLGGISYYSASSHNMYFSNWTSSGFLLRDLPEVGVRGHPFVVVVDDEPVYSGAFYTSASPASFDHPVILVEELEPTTDRATIYRAYPPQDRPGVPDPRSDSRIFDLLEEAGKLAP